MVLGKFVDLPEDRKAIGSKWIYKIKFRSSGEIDRYKARLVAQGFGQKEVIDYEKTFSLVVKMVTVRLKKFLYGLKQAPRQWNAKLTSTLIENGFSQSKSDYSLYTKSNNGVFLALLVYVDDIIITCNSVSEIEKFKVFLKSKFMIKDLGKLKYFLGIEVVDTYKGICLNQRKYVLDLLSEYGMLACKPAKTPLMSKLVISNESSDKDPLLENITDYQKLMGKLIYFTNTRPDISYVVHCLRLGVHITKTSGMFLTAYFDVDWAKCIVIRKSVTSNSAIKIAVNPVFHERTKHFEIDLHFVREKVLKEVVKTIKVETKGGRGIENISLNRYWDVSWNNNSSTNSTVGTRDRLTATSCKVIVETEHQVELSFLKTWNSSLKGILLLSRAYILLRGSSGFYMYAIFEHLTGWLSFNLDESRVVFKLRKDKFHYMAMSDDRRRNMPLPDDRKPGRCEVLDYCETVLLVNPIEREFKGEVDDKYQYTCELQDLRVHGWISMDPPVYNMLDTLLQMFLSAHNSGLVTKFDEKDHWKKVLGPIFIYLNTVLDKEDPRMLWNDAKEQMYDEVKSWPYDFPASKDFQRAQQRGAISGRLFVQDSDNHIPAKGAYLGLASSGDRGSWQTKLK
ncbi:ribonuclease H-like domain-containing protein, partial [Tanacetum coccineum]